MARLPVFPLGTVLVPTAVLPLHIFEPRYQALMADLTGGGDALPPYESEFGVVLISRGSEVGGGEGRVAVGTVARLLEATRLSDGRWAVAVVGTRRFRVDTWLPDDPYPVGEISELDEADLWRDEHGPLLTETARAVRRAVALAAELGEVGARVTFELAEDPLVAAWQLAALAPVGPLDRQHLLETGDAAERLAATLRMVAQVAEVLALRLAGEQ
jgi:Lon protease-like protein